MAISVLKTAWGAVKGFFTEGGPEGAMIGAGQSVIKQEETGAMKTGVESAIDHDNAQQTEQNIEANEKKVTW